ncbi:nebulette [Clupea harengus]|uniref:Nebulette n=1 Tax=Clupea harengus TaxID=7950 RepID=A0A6P3VWR9_CLUHA|nr:nebulette [Clupea harengus]
MNPSCARCGKVVYATEKINCLDKYWHRGCFHCEVCRMSLNMNNYKGYEKKPYCNSHYPKQTFTIVADTPENLRLRQQSELQSQVKYRKDFEESKGRGFSFVVDTPELRRLRRTQEQISNAKYHQDFELSGVQGLSQGICGGHYLVRAQVMPNKQEVGNSSHKGVHQYIMEMDRRPGIIVAPVLPGAYYPSGHTQGHSYMHQTSMHSLRSVKHRAHPTMSVYRALYDYTARDTDEVSFREGDIIQHAQPIDDGWMYGTVQRTSRSGMLPANYVEGIR